MGLLIEDATKPKSNGLKKIVYILFVPILLLVAFVGAYTLYTEDQNKIQNSIGVSQNTTPSQLDVDLPPVEGTLFFSLISTSLGKNVHSPALSFFNIKERKLTGIPITPVSGSNTQIFQLATSFNSAHGVFLGLPFTEGVTIYNKRLESVSN